MMRSFAVKVLIAVAFVTLRIYRSSETGITDSHLLVGMLLSLCGILDNTALVCLFSWYIIRGCEIPTADALGI